MRELKPWPGIIGLIGILGLCGLVAYAPVGNSGGVAHKHPTADHGRDRSVAIHDQSTPPSFTDSSGKWVLSWDDEFDSPADLTKWSYMVGYPNNPEGTLQWYESANAAIKDGSLVITADRGPDGHQCPYGPCEYTSSSLTTQGIFAQSGGIFEARMKIPVEHAIWPAFWMASVNSGAPGEAWGELDVIEVNGKGAPNMAGGFAHENGQQVFSPQCEVHGTLSDRYHVYGIKWLNTGITWMVDGRPCGTMNASPDWPFDRPCYMMLTLAVGGAWPGGPDDSTHFPARMYVDWVRVYRSAS